MKKFYLILFDFLLKTFRIKSLFFFFKKYQIVFFIAFGLSMLAFLLWLRTFDLKEIIEYKQSLLALNKEQTFLFTMSFFVMYFFISVLGLPGTTLFNLISGFFFGLIKGTFIGIFSVSLGACGAFLLTRYFLKNRFIKTEKKKLKKIYQLLEKNTLYYLFALRMFPFAPLFFANIAMGLSSIKLSVFGVVSFFAMLPGVAIYANIGSQLSQLETLESLLSPNLIFSFMLIGIFPILMSFLFKLLKKIKKAQSDLDLETAPLLDKKIFSKLIDQILNPYKKRTKKQ